MIRTDQEGKWQLEAVTFHRFKTKREMDKFADKNASKIISVRVLKGDYWHERQVRYFGKTLELF